MSEHCTALHCIPFCLDHAAAMMRNWNCWLFFKRWWMNRGIDCTQWRCAALHKVEREGSNNVKKNEKDLDEVKRAEIAGRRHRDPSLKVRVRHTLRRALSKFMTVCLSVCVSYSQKEKGCRLSYIRRDETRHDTQFMSSCQYPLHMNCSTRAGE